MSDLILNDETTAIHSTRSAYADDNLRKVDRIKIRQDRKRNPRKESAYDAKNLRAIAMDIYRNGLQTPLEVSERPDGSLWLLKGHRRLAAIMLIVETGIPQSGTPGKADFEPGIPATPDFMPKIRCRVMKGLSLHEELDQLCDHTLTKGLDTQEKLMMAVTLTRAGFSHEFIAGKLGTSRSNYTNGLARVVIMPQCVFDNYMKDGKDKDRVKLPQKTLSDLYDGYRADLANGGKIKAEGPEFIKAWEKAVRGESPTKGTLTKSDFEEIAGVETDSRLRRIFQSILDGDRPALTEVLESLRYSLATPTYTEVAEGVNLDTGERIDSTVGDPVEV